MWKKPKVGFVKINSDASTLNRAGIGRALLLDLRMVQWLWQRLERGAGSGKLAWQRQRQSSLLLRKPQK